MPVRSESPKTFLIIDDMYFEELMKEVLHQTRDTPLAQRHPFGKIPSRHRASNAQRGLAPATPLHVWACGESEKGWGVPKKDLRVTSVNNIPITSNKDAGKSRERVAGKEKRREICNFTPFF